MFHIELRCHLERVHRFNMSAQALLAEVLMPWARGESVELGERTWRPDETTITVLEGPEIPIGGLTMSRGWPTALREGRDVTEAVMASAGRSVAARAAAAAATAPVASAKGAQGVAGVLGAQGAQGALGVDGVLGAQGASEVLADAFGLQLLHRLGDGPLSLNAVWRLAGERHPEMQASGSLQLAMSAVASLLRASLATLMQADTGKAVDLAGDDLEARVQAMDGWLGEEGQGALRIGRA